MTARSKFTVFEVSHTDARGNRITGQLYTAEHVSRRLQDLLEWGCTNITVREYKDDKKEFNYKDFTIKSVRGGYAILNLNGVALRRCKTIDECKERIDNQTV